MINNFDLVTRPDNNPSDLGKYITDHSDNGFEGFVKTVGADLRTGSSDTEIAIDPQNLAERRFLFNLLDQWWILGETHTDESAENLRRDTERLFIQIQQDVSNQRYHEYRRHAARKIEKTDIELPLIFADWATERITIVNRDIL